jgi:hypothetical protein
MPFLGETTARIGALRKWLFERVTVPECIALFVGAILVVVVHASQFAHVFGEADGARMANDATGWHIAGKVHLETTEYRMRTSPLYLQGLKTALDQGLAMRHLPRFMAWTSLVSSVMGLLAAYFLFRSLIGRVGAAIASVFLLLAPVYWLSGAYGMAHGPGLTALLVALLVFSLALDEENTPRRFFWISALAAFWVFVALALKADLVLNGLAFPALAFARRRLTKRTFVVSSALVVVPFLAQMAYVHALVTALPTTQTTAQFAQAYNDRFPFELHNIGAELSCITHAPGSVLFVVGLVAAVHQLLSRSGFRLAVFAIAWGLPIVIFWGLQHGNSARHNLSATPALALLAGAFVVSVTEAPWRAAVLATLIALGNYVSDTEGETGGFGTLAPRSDVLALMPGVTQKSEETQAWARGFGRIAAPKKALVARWSLPFAHFEALRAHEGEKNVTFDGHDVIVTKDDGTTIEARTVYAVTPAIGQAALRSFRERGFNVTRRDW